MAAPTRDAPRTLALRALLTLPNALLRGHEQAFFKAAIR